MASEQHFLQKTLQGISVTLKAATVGQLLIKRCRKLLIQTTGDNLITTQKPQGRGKFNPCHSYTSLPRA